MSHRHSEDQGLGHTARRDDRLARGNNGQQAKTNKEET